MIAISRVGFPHSDTPGSSLAYSSPRLFAVRRVLLRLFAPRHPPSTLSSLTWNLVLHKISMAPCVLPSSLFFQLVNDRLRRLSGERAPKRAYKFPACKRKGIFRMPWELFDNWAVGAKQCFRTCLPFRGRLAGPARLLPTSPPRCFLLERR
jgi:hypothetical protein